MAITIIVKHESCDNLLKQTIDFLETIQKIRNQIKQNLVITVKQDNELQDHFMIIDGKVIWGKYDILIKLKQLICQQMNTNTNTNKSQGYPQDSLDERIRRNTQDVYTSKNNLQQSSDQSNLVARYLQQQANSADQEKSRDQDDFRQKIVSYEQVKNGKSLSHHQQQHQQQQQQQHQYNSQNQRDVGSSLPSLSTQQEQNSQAQRGSTNTQDTDKKEQKKSLKNYQQRLLSSGDD